MFREIAALLAALFFFWLPEKPTGNLRWDYGYTKGW